MYIVLITSEIIRVISFYLAVDMKVSIVLLAAFGIVVATCVALPFSEREDEAQLSEVSYSVIT